MKTVLITGSNGFIGRNLSEHLSAKEDVKVLSFDRSNSIEELENRVLTSDFIFHIAGVNRPKNESDFQTDNTNLTSQIISILKANDKKTPLLITSSTQAVSDNPYGVSKRLAEESVFEWNKESGSPVYVFRLPGIFGKWSKPNYNSVVATFCHNIANGMPIEISDPNYVVTLSYIDDVVGEFTQLLSSTPDTTKSVSIQSISKTFEVSLGELSERIYALHSIRTSLVVPDLSDLLNKYLYATYISYLDEGDFSYSLNKNVDERGWLSEFIKSESFGQIFISKTKPGITRGDHWHHTKIEKFLVVSGKAEITFRNKLTESNHVIKYEVDGDEAKVLDIPTGYVHAIKNIGETDLVTIFWADEILDKNRTDTYYEKVSKEDAL